MIFLLGYLPDPPLQNNETAVYSRVDMTVENNDIRVISATHLQFQPPGSGVAHLPFVGRIVPEPQAIRRPLPNLRLFPNGIWGVDNQMNTP